MEENKNQDPELAAAMAKNKTNREKRSFILDLVSFVFLGNPLGRSFSFQLVLGILLIILSLVSLLLLLKGGSNLRLVILFVGLFIIGMILINKGRIHRKKN